MVKEFIEKRKFRRFNFSLPIRYRKLQSDSSGFKGTLLRDIGQGGVRMNAYEFLPLNLRLAMDIPLMSGLKPVEGVCRVAWTRKASFAQQYDVGVEFVEINQEDQGQITKFISGKASERM